VVIFSTVNAYTAGMGRVVYAAARDGSLPRFLGTVDPKTGTPRRALLALFAMITVSLVVFYTLRIDIQSAFLATSGAAVLTYIVGSAAGVRLLKRTGARRLLPWISLVVAVAILPFIGQMLLASLVVAGLGLAYGHSRARS
jgi:amino acid efflux transporter